MSVKSAVPGLLEMNPFSRPGFFFFFDSHRVWAHSPHFLPSISVLLFINRTLLNNFPDLTLATKLRRRKVSTWRGNHR
jgi:hypothetical protein